MTAAFVAALLLVGTLASVQTALVGRRASAVRRRIAAARTVRTWDPAAVLARFPAPPVMERLLAERAARRYGEAIPVALDGLARSLRSGGGVRDGLVEASRAVGGGVGADLAYVVVAADVVGLDAALTAWAVRRPAPGVRLAAAALALGTETGGAQAAAIDGLAATLRQQQAVRGEARSLAAQARLSAVVIGLAPVGFASFTMATDRTTAGFLLGTPLGWGCLMAGLTLDAAGWWWMSRITRVMP